MNEAIFHAMRAEGLVLKGAETGMPQQDRSGENPCAITADSGNLEIRFNGPQDWMNVPQNSPMRIGDTVRFKGNGRARLIFPDGSYFLLKSNTELTLQNEQVDPVTGGVVVQLERRGSNFQVKTPNSCFGALGTTFSITVGHGGRTTLLRVAEGLVSFTSTRTNQIIKVGAGQSVLNTDEGLGPITRFPVPTQL